MRRFAAIIVIILISFSYSEANSKFDLDYDGDLPSRSPLEKKTKEDKILKEALVVGGCPLCDSSVYSYCDQKIYHDACCCGLPAAQCQYADCSYIHANSCKEHQLITKCCCYNPYRKL